MKEIHIYSKSYCPFCRRAIELLNIKGISFNTIDVTDNYNLEEEMRLRSGQSTVPQIFIGPQYIGGCDELFTLDELGQLDTLLAQFSV
jgi:glutaredoxin 3